MVRDKAYYVGTHPHQLKRGKPAEIVGVEVITPKGDKPRLCYHIMWNDKTEDWVPVSDTDNYKIISFDDILSGKMPEVTN